jgi:hypothetical protein
MEQRTNGGMEEVIEDRSSAADGLRERGDLVKDKGKRRKDERRIHPLSVTF